MQKLTLEEFKERAQKIHQNKYDYSNTKYVNSRHLIEYICPEHGVITQKASSHLMGFGCKYCGYANNSEKQRMTQEIFIQKAKEIHGDKYDYSKTKYINSNTKICIICPEHGEFWQTAGNHLSGHGCDKCGGTSTNTLEDFIQKAKSAHGEKYDYSKVEYINNNTKVCIICPKHGEFWQTPDKHFQGRGCPFCRESINEEKCRSFLQEKNIDFIQEKTFDWLVDKGLLKLDFYIPKYNLAIEYQGEQHFHIIKKFGGKEDLQKRKYRDNLKKDLCLEHGINIEYITYNEKTIDKLIKILEKYEHKRNAS